MDKSPRSKIKKQQDSDSDKEDSEEEDDHLSPKDEYSPLRTENSLHSMRMKGLNKITNVPHLKTNLIEDMKKRSTVFFELEAQSNFLKNITSIDQMIDVSNFTPFQTKLLNLKKNHQKTPTETNGISVEDLNFDSKKYGNEFNQSKYVTMKQKNLPKSDRSPTKNIKFFSKPSKLNLKNFSFKPQNMKNTIKRQSFLLSEIDEENIDRDVFENNLKTIVKNHIEYQVKNGI